MMNRMEYFLLPGVMFYGVYGYKRNFKFKMTFQ